MKNVTFGVKRLHPHNLKKKLTFTAGLLKTRFNKRVACKCSPRRSVCFSFVLLVLFLFMVKLQFNSLSKLIFWTHSRLNNPASLKVLCVLDANELHYFTSISRPYVLEQHCILSFISYVLRHLWAVPAKGTHVLHVQACFRCNYTIVKK